MHVQALHKRLEVRGWPLDYCRWIDQGSYNIEWHVYEAHLQKQHTFVDLGAWVGAHSLYASDVAHKVVAVEPDPVAFAILAQNVKGHLWQKAISDHNGVVKMGSALLGASTTRANPAAGGGIGAWVEGQTFDVECLRLRELVEHLPDPLFIKIDVEGSEEAIFPDFKLFYQRNPVVLVELHPFWWKDPAKTWQDFEVLKSLYKKPYEVHHKNSNTWVLID